MKFFRMDSDFARWPEWDELSDGDGRKRRDYMAIYIALYAEIAAHYRDSDQRKFELIERNLREGVGMVSRRWQELVTNLSRSFHFRVTFVSGRCHLEYPNFLKKQKIPKRDGDGKFSNTGRREESREESRDIDIKRHSRETDKICPDRKPVDNLGKPDSPEHAQLDSADSDQKSALQHEFEFSPPDNSKPPDLPPMPDNPNTVRGQTEFDNKTARRIYEFVKLATSSSRIERELMRKAKPETWGNSIKRLRIEDGVPEQEISTVLDWSLKNHFWKDQIRSAYGFRKSFPEMRKQYLEHKENNRF